MSIYRELAYDRPIAEIKGIQFCILSEHDIRRRSVVEVTENQTFMGNEPVQNGLFDLRMGVVDGSRVCATCEQLNTFCPGHFGHITLARPVFYVQFFDVVRKLMKCVCFRCSRILVDLEGPEARRILNKKISRQKRWDAMAKLCSKVKSCGADTVDGCGAKVPDKVMKTEDMRLKLVWKDADKGGASSNGAGHEIVVNAEDVLRVLRRVSDLDCEALGFSAEHNRPERMICTVLPVPPPAVRPSVRHETGQRQEDDLTHKLSDIIKRNKIIKDCKERGTSTYHTIETMHAPLLQYHVATLIDNSIPTMFQAKDRAGRAFRTLTERLKHKDGRIRGNLMGKRVDFSARTVITPDPNISIDELGVPLKIAMNLTFPAIVGPNTRAELQRLVLSGPDVYPGAKQVRKAAESNRTIRLRGHPDPASIVLEDGDVVERHLLNGDWVLFNRQPSLHKMSMMAHRVRVMSYNTFRLNVMACSSYNADFDGDEMNMHVPQSLQTQYELRELAAVPLHILSPRYSRPIIGPVQDVALGVFRITQPGVSVSQRQLYNLSCGNQLLGGFVTTQAGRNNAALSGNRWTGREVLSTVLPPTASLHMKTEDDASKFVADIHDIRVVDGIIKSGVLSEKAFSKASVGLVHSTYNTLGPDAVIAMLNSTQKLICDWLVLSGFSVGVADMVIKRDTVDKKNVKIAEAKREVLEMLRKVHAGTFENNSTKNDADMLEEKIGGILGKVATDAYKMCRDGFDIGNNRLLNMIESGSKGKTVNFQQMTACLGPQSIEGRRVIDGFNGRTLPHFTKYDDGPEARGFVEHSFIEGLTPHEFFFHSMAGRIGLIDTAVRTSETGYLQRRLVKAMEDCKIAHDLTVRNANNFIIQFLYGEDGMDAIKLEYHDMKHVLGREPADLRNDFLLTDPEADLKSFVTPEVLEKMKKDEGAYQTRCAGHFKKILEDRRKVIVGLYKGLQENLPIVYPVNVSRIVEQTASLHAKQIVSASSASSGPLSDLDPLTILDRIKELSTQLVVGRAASVEGVKWMPMLLRVFLSPKQIIRKHRLNRAAFERVVAEIRKTFYDSVAHPGEMVGIVGAQSLGEPSTQLSSLRSSRMIVSSSESVFDGPIGDFIDELMNKNPDRVVDLGGGSQVFDPDEDIYVVSVSNEEKTNWRRILQVSRHPANGGMVRIHTSSGKTTCATLSHSFLKRTESGIEPILGSELKVGDRVPIARAIPDVPSECRRNSVMIGGIDISLNRDLGWLCGVYLADGYLNSNTIGISKVIPEYQEEIKRIAMQVFGLPTTLYVRNAGTQNTQILDGWDMSQYPSSMTNIHDRNLAQFFLENFGTGSAVKRIPGWVYSAPIEFVSGVLCGYFDGDGNVNCDIGKQMIRSASVSEKLTEDFVLLLARVGIFGSKCRETHVQEAGRNDLHTIQISRKYARAFNENVGPLVVRVKQDNLESVIQYVEREDNHSSREQIDRIPELGDVLASIGKTLELDGQSRLYGRWTKKEAIGRETLRSYISVFETGLQSKLSRDAIIRTERQSILDDIYGLHPTLRPSAIRHVHKFDCSTMQLSLDLMQSLLRLGTELLGMGQLCSNSVYSKYTKSGKIRKGELVSFLEKLESAMESIRVSNESAIVDVRDNKLPILSQALNSDVVWDEIVKIDVLPDPGEMVYDLTVPGNDSFMVDCGVLVHNTLNSVVHGTELIMRTEGRVIRQAIGEFVEESIEQSPEGRIERHPNDTTLAWLKEGGDAGLVHSGMEVLSTDEDGRVMWKEVTAVTRHPVVNKDGSDTLIEVATESGRSVIATKGKSFLTRRNNKLVVTEGDDLRVDDYLPITRTLKIEPSDTIEFLDVDRYLPRKEFLYQRELAKAIECSKKARNWFKGRNERVGNGHEFIVPHATSESIMICFRVNQNAPDERKFREGCVYPKSQGPFSKGHVHERVVMDEVFGFYIGAYLGNASAGNSKVSGYECANNNEPSDKISRDCDQIQITTKNDDYKNRIIEFAERYSLGFSYSTGRNEGVSVNSKVICELTTRMCGQGTSNKRIAPELMTASDAFLSSLIDAYFSACGSCSGDSYIITTSSCSRGLLDDISNVLLRFDIGSSISTCPDQGPDQGTEISPRYILKIRNGDSLRFAQRFERFTETSFQDALKLMQRVAMVNLCYHTPEDIVPDLHLPGSNTTISMVHRDSLPQLASVLTDTNDIEAVQKALGEDVWYDKIVSIEDVPNPKGPYVYDLTVRDTRTFVLWNGMSVQDTFHLSGVSSSVTNVTRGVPRMKEIMSMSKNIKTPSMKIRLRREWATSQERTQAVLSTLETTHFRDVVKRTSVHFDPSDMNTRIKEDEGLLAFYRDFAGTDDAPNSAASCPWVLRFEFDRMKMLNLQVTMLDLEYTLVDHFDDAVTAVLSDDNADHLVCRLRLNALADVEESTDLLTEMKAMEQAVMDQLVIKGVKGIDKAVPLKPSSGLKKYDPVSDAYVMDDEWYIETAGTNLMEVLCHPCVDYTRTFTNDIYEIYQVLGIEAARQAVIDEMRAVLDSTPIDHRHLSLLADTMSNRGFFMSIDRHGINNRGELGPLAKASFEQSTDMLIKAGIFSERDRINGVSANIMLGQVAPCGTGDCSVLMDNERMVALGKPVISKQISAVKAPQASVAELPELEVEAAVDKKKVVRRKKVDEIEIV